MKRTAAAISALLLALAPISAHAVVPGTRFAEQPEKYGLQYAPAEIPTPDKATVFGWWFAGPARAPVMVLAPGGTGTMASLLPVAREFHDRGFSVLTFDYRDFGPSGVGPQDSLHYVVRSSRWISDMQGALRFARVKSESAAVFSWGGPDLASVVALGAAARERGLCEGVVMECVYPTADEELKANGTSVIPEAAQQQAQQMLARDEPIAAGVTCRAPVLLVGGSRDTLTPPGATANLIAHGRTRLDRFIIPGAGHENLASTPGYFDRVSDWVRHMSQFADENIEHARSESAGRARADSLRSKR